MMHPFADRLRPGSPSSLLAALTALLLLALAAAPHAARAQQPTPDSTASSTPLAVGSKKFTENVILGWMATQLLQDAGYAVEHRAQLGGSRFLWEALLRGDIDVYPEYTGTLIQEILAGEDVTDATLSDALARRGLRMTEPLGFDNTYAIGMKAEQAERLGIETIADLRTHPDLAFAFTNEFMDRSDGWPGLKQTYSLPQQAQGVDHDIAYRGLQSGSVDVVDLYATDAEIEAYNIRVLDDSRSYFPEYKAVYLYRADLAERAPDAIEAIERLEDAFTEETMTALNKRANIDQVDEAEVSAQYLNESLDLNDTVEATTLSRAERIWARTQEHLVLVGISLIFAIVLAIPLGIVAAKAGLAGRGVLLIVGIIYTIPSLALLAVMVPPLGLGRVPAVAALFLYSLLPIVWNTYTGLNDLDRPLMESALALGLPGSARLRLVELPLAMRSILAGIKIAVVINVGTATLGALIGAGGYGQPILTGIRRANLGLILEGTVPAALLTVLLLALFEGLERALLPRGLRSGQDTAAT